MSRALPLTATNKVIKRQLRAERWNCAEPVLWRPAQGSAYEPLTDADATTLEGAVGHRVL
jgi:fatty-acyl-CoA synthase